MLKSYSIALQRQFNQRNSIKVSGSHFSVNTEHFWFIEKKQIVHVKDFCVSNVAA